MVAEVVEEIAVEVDGGRGGRDGGRGDGLHVQ
jgi:hypothetical protein